MFAENRLVDCNIYPYVTFYETSRGYYFSAEIPFDDNEFSTYFSKKERIFERNIIYMSNESSIKIFDCGPIVVEGEEEKNCITNGNIIVPGSMYFITIESPVILEEIKKNYTDVSRNFITYETILDSVKKSFVFSTYESHINGLYGIQGCGMFFLWNPACLDFHICRNCNVKIVLGTDEYPGLLLLLLHCESQKSNTILGYNSGFDSFHGNTMFLREICFSRKSSNTL
ncbi:MAG: hypothetical protein ACI4SG_01710 [Oligosphaeraceae bacterium]